MATLRRGLVDKVKKAASKVRTRGVQVAAKAGTRGARALVETTVAAVKTVDKLQQKLGRSPGKARTTEQPKTGAQLFESTRRQSTPRASPPMTSKAPETPAMRPPAKTAGAATKPRRATSASTSEAQPVELREAGRKTMAAAAPKRAKKTAAPGKQFKVKRGQKHLHSGR
jgi:hypothetical protein